MTTINDQMMNVGTTRGNSAEDLGNQFLLQALAQNTGLMGYDQGDIADGPSSYSSNPGVDTNEQNFDLGSMLRGMGPLGSWIASLLFGGEQTNASGNEAQPQSVTSSLPSTSAMIPASLQSVASSLFNAHDVTGNKVDLFKGGAITLGTDDLQKIAQDPSLDVGTRTAAQYLAENPDKFDELESCGQFNGTGQRGIKDGRIGLADVSDMANGKVDASQYVGL